MQRSQKNGKKNQGRTGEKNSESEVLPNLMLLQKQNPETSILQKVTTTVANYVGAKAGALLSSQASKPIARPTIEEEKKRIHDQLARIAAKLTPLDNELTSIDDQIKKLKKDKQPVPPDLLTNRRRLRELIDHMQSDQVTDLAENICEHSARRIDFFFYLLIAVYKQNVVVTKARTDKQHGKGSEKTLTAGCHSSLFPSLTFTKIQPSTASSVANSIWSMFGAASAPMISPRGEQILNETYFAEILNVCMELPVCVNKFDCHMERHGFAASSLVDIATGILNRTARGDINPIQGLNEFCDALNSSFNYLHHLYIEPEVNYSAEGTRGKTPRSFAKIWEYEREGALRNMAFYDDNKHTKHAAASWEYIYLMLGMHKMPLYKRTASLVYSGYALERIMEIQQEIFNMTFDPDNKIFKEALKNAELAKATAEKAQLTQTQRAAH